VNIYENLEYQFEHQCQGSYNLLIEKYVCKKNTVLGQKIVNLLTNPRLLDVSVDFDIGFYWDHILGMSFDCRLRRMKRLYYWSLKIKDKVANDRITKLIEAESNYGVNYVPDFNSLCIREPFDQSEEPVDKEDIRDALIAIGLNPRKSYSKSEVKRTCLHSHTDKANGNDEAAKENIKNMKQILSYMETEGLEKTPIF